MKKLYSILSVFLVVIAVSCVREESAAIEEPFSEELTVPVVLSFQEPVTLQANTKAELGMEMGDNPAISHIHVAIFGTDRYLKDYVSAYPCDSEGNPLPGGYASSNATTAYFLARLPITSKERVLHIIANGPSTVPFNAYENDIMQNLRTSNGNGAYWQRIVLSSGIAIKETDGVPQQTPEGEYIPTDATVAALSNISLIRNFASITVTEEAPNFQIVAYTLCNMPKSGSIAMYSTNHGDWVPSYSGTSINLDSEYLYKYEDSGSTVKTYLGFPTSPELDTNIPTTEDAFNAPGVTVGLGEPIYVYERAVTGDNAPFILMAARYVSVGTPTDATPIHYYRLDLTTENGYFPIYRNFQYTFNITSVTVDGYSDLGNASKHNSGSNFSVSMDTSTLPDVSNGVVRLYVEKSNFDWVYTSATQSFWYKFLLNSDSSVINNNVTVTEKEGGNAIASYSKAGSNNADGTRSVNYTLNVPDGTSTLSSTLQLVGTYTSGPDTYKLVRNVTIRVFNAKEIHPTLNPSTVADQADQLTTLGIPLPWDLQSSMFPMQILIEDSAKALNPAPYESMPVLNTDIEDTSKEFKSLTNNSTPSYCFVRTLNWSEYQRLKNNAELSGSDDIILNCDFETTKSFSTTTVYVYNKYFKTNASGVTTAQVTLTGDQNNNITPNRQTISGTAATVTVKASGAWTLSISLANGNVASGTSLSPSSGSATAGEDVSVTLPENVTENAIKYLLTLSSPGGNRTAYITQEGIAMTLTSATTNIGNGGNASTSVQVTVESGSRYVLEVINPDGTVYSTSEEYNATTGPTNRTVNIPPNTTLSARTFTIRARNLLSTIWRDITVTQAAGTATLDIVNSDIRMNATTAAVNVSSSFAATLRASMPSIPEWSFEKSNASGSETISSIPANGTGVNRTIQVDLCNASGTVLLTKYITQLGVPYLALTATGPTTNLANVPCATTLSIDSELSWSVSVDDGTAACTATLTPSSGSATGGTSITLDLSYNTTLNPKTYTVTANNGTSNDYPHKIVTVTQAAGVVSAFNVIDSEIMMQESSATVHVDASFPTRLYIYDNSDPSGNPLPDPITVLAGARDVEAVVGTHTGAARTYTLKLCNENGDVVAGDDGSITFTQKPMIRITAANASVKGNENATVNVISDVDWTLTSTNGGTFGTYSGTPTTGAEAVTVTMPVNYTTSDVIFMITAQGTGANSSLSDSVNITHRKATALNNQTFNFAPNLYSSPNTSVTREGMTAAYERVIGYNNSYLEINNTSNTSTTLTISIIDNVANNKQVRKIKQVYVDYSLNRGPGSTSSTPSGITNSTTLGRIANSTWSGEVTSGNLQLTFVRASGIGTNNTRISEVTVTYDAVSWE